MAGARSLSYRQNPRVYFFIFLATNGLLSYLPLSLQAKITLGLLGVALPFYVALRNIDKASRNEKPPYLNELNFSPPTWLWVSGLLLALFLRFYRFENLFGWPNL